MKKGILFYTADYIPNKIRDFVLERLKIAAGNIPICVVSQTPIKGVDWNIVVGMLENSYESMYRQMEVGLLNLDCDTVFFTEHDVLYPEGYFDFERDPSVPFIYAKNCRRLYSHGFFFTKNIATSRLCACRRAALSRVRKRLYRFRLAREEDPTYNDSTYAKSELGIEDCQFNFYTAPTWTNSIPVIDIIHEHNFSYTIKKYHAVPTRKGSSSTLYWGDYKTLLRKMGIENIDYSAIKRGDL